MFTFLFVTYFKCVWSWHTLGQSMLLLSYNLNFGEGRAPFHLPFKMVLCMGLKHPNHYGTILGSRNSQYACYHVILVLKPYGIYPHYLYCVHVWMALDGSLLTPWSSTKAKVFHYLFKEKKSHKNIDWTLIFIHWMSPRPYPFLPFNVHFCTFWLYLWYLLVKI